MKRFLIDRADPAVPVPPVRGSAALLVSAALHGTLVVAAFLVSRERLDPVAADSERSGPASVQLVYMPPPEPATRTQPTPRTAEPAREPPDPVREQPYLPEQQAPAQPPAPEMHEVPEHDEPAGAAAGALEPEELAGMDAADRSSAAPEGSAPSAAELMRSEAQRLFGRRRQQTVPRGGPAAAPGFEVYLPPNVDACGAAPPRRPGEAVELATVSGRVYREGTRIPLPGAHLQMIGTPYVTFADDTGAYDLRFDPALVDRCRTQYVRVTAPGFRAQTLVLYLGPSASNDIPMSRR